MTFLEKLYETSNDLKSDMFPEIVRQTENNMLSKSTDINYLMLNVHTFKKTSRFYMQFDVLKNLSIISQYYHKFYAFTEIGRNAIVPIHTFRISTWNLAYSSFRLVDLNIKSHHLPTNNSASSIQKLVDIFEKDLSSLVFPKIQELCNVHKLDKIINHPYDTHLRQHLGMLMQNTYFDKMIVAKLAGNPEYERIFKFLVDFISILSEKRPKEPQGPLYKMALHEIYDKLKDVEPLKDPNLDNYEIDYPLVKDFDFD